MWSSGTFKKRELRDMVIMEKNRRWVQRKRLLENVEKLDICVTQGSRYWRPVFVERVLPQCSRDPLAAEDGLWPQVWLTTLELVHFAGIS